MFVAVVKACATGRRCLTGTSEPLCFHPNIYVLDGRAADRWTTIAAAAYGLYRYHDGNAGKTLSIGSTPAMTRAARRRRSAATPRTTSRATMHT